MEILKVVEALEAHCTDERGIVKDDGLSTAMAAAAALLVGQGEKIADLESKVAELETQNRWIPVTERLPANFVSVLGYMPAAAPFPPVRECYTVGNAFYFPALTDTQMVTHWMPLPQPPKEEAV